MSRRGLEPQTRRLRARRGAFRARPAKSSVAIFPGESSTRGSAGVRGVRWRALDRQYIGSTEDHVQTRLTVALRGNGRATFAEAAERVLAEARRPASEIDTGDVLQAAQPEATESLGLLDPVAVHVDGVEDALGTAVPRRAGRSPAGVRKPGTASQCGTRVPVSSSHAVQEGRRRTAGWTTTPAAASRRGRMSSWTAGGRLRPRHRSASTGTGPAIPDVIGKKPSETWRVLPAIRGRPQSHRGAVQRCDEPVTPRRRLTQARKPAPVGDHSARGHAHPAGRIRSPTWHLESEQNDLEAQGRSLVEKATCGYNPLARLRCGRTCRSAVTRWLLRIRNGERTTIRI